MNKKDFINELKEKLRGLPEEEVDNAINYYIEYFEDAGINDDIDVELSLGTPDDVANQILLDYNIKNNDESLKISLNKESDYSNTISYNYNDINEKNNKKKMSKGIISLLIILGVFASPILIPLAFALVVVVFALVITLFALGFSFVIASGAIVIAGIASIIGSLFILTKSFENFIMFLGIGLIGIGLGIILLWLSINGVKLLFNIIKKLINISFGSGINIYDESKRVTENFDLEEFNTVKIDVSYLDNIEIVKGNEYKLSMDYHMPKNDSNKIEYSLDNKVLSIKDNRSNNMNINIGFFKDKNNKIILYVPEECNLEELNIQTCSSDINVTNINSKIINIVCDYGDVILSNSSSHSITLDSSSGEIEVINIQGKDMKIDNSYGDVKLENTSLSNLDVYMSCGDFDGANLNVSEEYKIENSYGDIDIENSNINNTNASLSCGDFEFDNVEFKNLIVDNEYGQVSIDTPISENSFNYKLECDYGEIEINGNDFNDSYLRNNNVDNNINIKCSSGDIHIELGNNSL